MCIVLLRVIIKLVDRDTGLTVDIPADWSILAFNIQLSDVRVKGNHTMLVFKVENSL